MSSEESCNPLLCPICKEYRYLSFEKKAYGYDELEVGYKIPYFKCDNCNKTLPLIPDDKIEEMAKNHLDHLMQLGKSGFYSLRIRGEDEKFEKYHNLGLKYDSRDYYYIPGLIRPWNDGSLTPVFFDLDLLLYYNNHPDYRVYMQSFSNVIIYKNDEALIPWGFGINRNEKLFTWLKDLDSFLSKSDNVNHLNRFKASNIDSDHDIFSDFYLMQIEVRAEEPNNENQIFRLKNIFEKLIFEKFKFEIFKVDIAKLKYAYKSPVLNEKNQVFNAYIKLNILLIDNINATDIRKLLQNEVDPTDLKNKAGLKLLELFFEHKLNISRSDNLISPLFVLYDLRLLAAHLTDDSFNEKYDSCKERLNADMSLNYMETFKQVVKSIIDMFDELNKVLEEI